MILNHLLTVLLLQLLSRFSRVRLFATPQTAAHQAPPSLGFSRQDTGVGCHFLLQCMKVKSESEVAQSCPTQRPHGLQPTRLLRPWDFPGKDTGWVAISSLRGYKMVSHCGLICLFLMTNDVEHFFMCLLAVYLLWRNMYSDPFPIHLF